MITLRMMPAMNLTVSSRSLLLAGLFDGVLPRGIENAEILVPGLRDGLAQPACACPVGTVGHRPAARGQVHGGLLDTGHVLQGHLDSPHAGRAGHPPDGDGRFLHGSGARLFPGDHFIAQVADLFGHRVGTHRRRVDIPRRPFPWRNSRRRSPRPAGPSGLPPRAARRPRRTCRRCRG